MANKNTKRNRVNQGYGVKTGRTVNSSAERAKSGKRPYCAPTMKKHGQS